MNRQYWSVVLIALLASACQQTPVAERAGVDDPRNLKVRDWRPTSMLRVKQTDVPRAKFPAIDVHNHLGRFVNDPDAVQEMIRVMDAANVERVVSLDGTVGEKFEQHRETFLEPYPDRFIVATRMDWERVNDPGFGDTMAREIADAVSRGAKALKVSKRLGLFVKDADGRYIAVNDPRFEPVWTRCGELGIPVEIHIADPAAFFTPLDRLNERIEELMDHPNWAFNTPEYYSFRELKDQLEDVVRRHPATTFIGLHVGCEAEDLGEVSRWLDTYPNFNVETGARLSELGRQPYTARRFFLKYQDRILFGTDTPPNDAPAAVDGVDMYATHWRWFETDDEFFDVSATHHYQANWKAYGIFLPDEVLKKVYNANARRLFRL